MKYLDLIKKGDQIYEKDFTDGFIYLYSETYIVHENMLYCHEEHPNTNRYTGKTDTYLITDNFQKALEEKSWCWWEMIGIPYEVVEDYIRSYENNDENEFYY